MADNSAILALARSPPNASASAWYRSPVPAATASASSPASAASTRGSSCAASATTRTQPGSATTARRSTRGICSAPPPLVAHRPETTPPTTYSGWNRPPVTHSSSQDQPYAPYSLASSLYSSSRAAAERGGDPCGQVGQALRAQAGHRLIAEQAGQQGGMDVGTPRQAVVAHLGRHQPGRRLRRREQREPARVVVGGDPAQLVGPHRDERVQRIAGAGGAAAPRRASPDPAAPPRASPDPAAPPRASPDPAAPPRRAQAAASVAGSPGCASLASSSASVSATS